jgi:hypothetical protein
VPVGPVSLTLFESGRGLTAAVPEELRQSGISLFAWTTKARIVDTVVGQLEDVTQGGALMFFVALGLSLASWMASPQIPAVQLPVALDAQVAGRVVDAVSRTPIAGATVMLVPTVHEFPPGAINTTAVTDAHGEFRIRPLPRGRYRIYVQKTGFARVTDFDAQTIDVAAGRSVTDVELALHAGAVIAGRIVDASGGQPPLLTVVALRQLTGPDGKTLATTAQRAETNTQGQFRVEGLAEGTYLLMAAPPPPPFASPRTPYTMVLAPTYYPGTADIDAAQVLTVVSGQVLDDLQFSLLLLPGHDVSGVVVDEAGSPLAGAIVALMADPAKGGLPTPTTGQTDQRGAFRIGGIVSGTYRLMAEIGAPPVATGGPNRSIGGGAVGGVFFGGVAPLEITVGDTDVTGLRIALSTSR